MAKIQITDEPRFLKWAKDEPLFPFPSDETFARWQEFGWVRPAEEGYALTTMGRRLAGLPTGSLPPTSKDGNDG